jgi:hypothetical protein
MALIHRQSALQHWVFWCHIHWGSTNIGLLGAYHLKINFITCERLELLKYGIVHLCGTPLIHLVKWVDPILRIMIGQYWCSF